MSYAMRFIPSFWDEIDRLLSSRGVRQERANHHESDRLFWLSAAETRRDLARMTRSPDPFGIADCEARAALAEAKRDWWAP